jgi:acetylornithine deacetylase/succinyl-diaminopimelate desuccinylase family protein
LLLLLLRKLMSDPEKLLCELIALPSVNPAFLTPKHRNGGELKAAEFLAAVAAKAGLEVELQRVAPKRSNIIARLTPSGKPTRQILLVPHLDTVNAEDNQFRPTRQKGRIFGRGACDTKGSIAVMMAALCDLARNPGRPANTEIVFAGVVDEENGQLGSRALAASGIQADLAIVGEPTCLQVVSAHKGSLWLSLETFGKSAHGSRPELGKNAIHSMARIVDLLQTQYSDQLKKRCHPLLGQPTVSVGVIAGGTQTNIVPDQCRILVDRRTLPGETEKNVWEEIQTLLRRHGLKAKLGSSKLAPCLPMETNPRLPLVTEFMRCVGQRKALGVKYFCDAAVLAASGIPSVVFGPGDIAQAHTADEWVEIRALHKAKGLLMRFLGSLP